MTTNQISIKNLRDAIFRMSDIRFNKFIKDHADEKREAYKKMLDSDITKICSLMKSCYILGLECCLNRDENTQNHLRMLKVYGARILENYQDEEINSITEICAVTGKETEISGEFAFLSLSNDLQFDISMLEVIVERANLP